MAQTHSISKICQRIRSFAPQALYWGKYLAKKWWLSKEKICFARPYFSLVRKKILQPQTDAPDISCRPNERLQLQNPEKEPSALKREASQAHNCSMDSRHQRLAVYTYMWARRGKISPKPILLVRTKQLTAIRDNLLFPAQQSVDAWPLAQKYAFHVVREKEEGGALSSLPQPAEPDFAITRPMAYKGPVLPL